MNNHQKSLLTTKTPPKHEMIDAVILKRSALWEKDDYLKETFPDKGQFLANIKQNLEKWPEEEVLRSYWG